MILRYRNIILSVVVFFFFLSLAFLKTSSAYFSQEDFYDWGVSARNSVYSNVLGETTQKDPDTQAEVNFYTPKVTPDSPFYFAKTSFEALQLAVTFDEKTRVKMRLSFAERRLAESKIMIEKGEITKGTKLLEQYEKLLEGATQNLKKIDEKGKGAEDLAKLVEKTTAAHTSVLENISLKIPEKEKAIIDKAIFASRTGMDRAADVLNEPAIPTDLLTRLNALRGQGIITQEEAATFTQAKSREEARKIFTNFVQQGTVPEADFKRFDTGQAKYFQNDFNKAVEIRKFNELVKFENQKPDEETKKQLEKFAVTFKPGDTVPPELRKDWAATIRLEEVQKTIRPDYINPASFKQEEHRFQIFQEIKDRVRPTADEVRFAEEYTQKNSQSTPPEVQRILDLKNKFGVVVPGVVPPTGHQEAGGNKSSEPGRSVNQGGEFRQPYYPSQSQNQNYQPYQETRPGSQQFAPPPQTDGPPPNQAPQNNPPPQQNPPSQNNPPPNNPPPGIPNDQAIPGN